MHQASNDVKPRRVAVIGRAGAGKTTVSLAVGGALGLPVVHLDRLFWGPGWAPVGREAFEAAQAKAIAADGWVIDGGYLSSAGWAERARRADLVLLVEAPLATCLWRIARRATARRGPRRPDLPDGCEELVNVEFVRWTVTWGRRARGPIDATRRDPAAAPVVRVRSVGEALAAARRPVVSGGGAARGRCRGG